MRRVACESAGSVNFVRGTEIEVHQCVGLWQGFAHVQSLEWMVVANSFVSVAEAFEGVRGFVLHVGPGAAWIVAGPVRVSRYWRVGLVVLRKVVCDVVKRVRRLAVAWRVEGRRRNLLREVLGVVWRLELVNWGSRLGDRCLGEWLQVVLVVLRDGVGEGVRWRRLDDVTDSHDPRVDFVRTHVLQEEAVEA